jgi:orotate phosphoribosyltransferase
MLNPAQQAMSSLPTSTVPDTETAQRIAALLLDQEAVRLRPQEPFTWASGWKSPIYCDNRLLLSDPGARRTVAEALVAGCEQVFGDALAHCTVVGVATAGIAHGLMVAERLQRPFAYVRSKAKGHGMGNRIEGRLPEGQPVLVVEDLVSTGGSSLAAVQALREAGAQVLGMAAIFTYGFPQAFAAFGEADCTWFTLSDYHHLIAEAFHRGTVQPEDRELLKAWREDPAAWNG